MANPTTPEPSANAAQRKVKVIVPEDVQAGSYSNAVSVNVTPNEVVIDFGYLMPASKEPVVRVLKRINMTHKTAESFMRVFQNAMLDFMNKHKK